MGLSNAKLKKLLILQDERKSKQKISSSEEISCLLCSFCNLYSSKSW